MSCLIINMSKKKATVVGLRIENFRSIQRELDHLSIECSKCKRRKAQLVDVCMYLLADPIHYDSGSENLKQTFSAQTVDDT